MISKLLEVKNEEEQQKILDECFRKLLDRKGLKQVKELFNQLGFGAEHSENVVKLFYELSFMEGILWAQNRLDEIEGSYAKN